MGDPNNEFSAKIVKEQSKECYICRRSEGEFQGWLMKRQPDIKAEEIEKLKFVEAKMRVLTNGQRMDKEIAAQWKKEGRYSETNLILEIYLCPVCDILNDEQHACVGFGESADYVIGLKEEIFDDEIFL